ncbi:MalY/PatB family protein [Pseudomonas sp. VE 196-7]|uniref:MalY/PatB family protein n=1 Tax=unclassified Pseudomonas TaxID=196821 RepID=UPI000D203972|nr:PatB family C-S lyase [Pseudomonas sp. VE 196-7]AVX89387.1 aminotransferase [Pseudomonas koreensis]MCU7213580.1 PatB family C-S lyase [Pseudomonas sp. VE 196-7]
MTFDFDQVFDRHHTGSTKWSRYPADVLPMWVADMDFAAPPVIIEALQQRLLHPLVGYSVAQDNLREAIVADLWNKFAWQVKPQELIFLPGVESGFNMALKALVQPQQNVVVQVPNYPPLRHAPGHWGLNKVELEFVAQADGTYATPLEALSQSLANGGALLLSNPHNPLGKVFSAQELTDIADICLAHDAWIISDEIHAELCFDGRVHVPTASLSPEIAKRTITLMSASKAYNIAGLKTSFMIIQDAALRERVNHARCGMVDSVNPLGMEATRVAYSEGAPWLAELKTYLQANRDWLVAAVRSRLSGVTLNVPQGTYLAWLDCSALDLDNPQQFFLEQAKVGLSAGLDFGDQHQQFVRLNFGCPRSLLEEGIRRMEQALIQRNT